MSAFRSVTPEVTQSSERLPDPKPNLVGGEQEFKDLEPVEGDSVVLKALGIDDNVQNLPSEEQENVQEVKNYVMDILKSKGVMNSQTNFNQTLSSLKEQMGLAEETEPSIILDRIGGVVKAWKSLSFVTDMKEKRGILMKLARMESSHDMHREVFKVMEQRKVWQ